MENKNINEGNSISKDNSNMTLSISNLSKLTNFVDSKLYEINNYNSKKDFNNINKSKKNDNKKKEIDEQSKQNKKLIQNKKQILNDNVINNNYFIMKNKEKSNEREPKDSIRKGSPKDNDKKKTKNNIFKDEDLSPTKKLINTNKKDVINLNSKNFYKNILSSKIVFNNEMKKKFNKRNKSKETILKRYDLNDDKDIDKKEYEYTSIFDNKKNQFDNLNQNISINNNIIINYKN